MWLLRPQVTAIGSDGHGRGHVLGIDVAGTESYDSWLRFLKTIGEGGVSGVVPVASDAREGLRRAIQETSRGAAWQRCVVHLMRDCVREATSQQLRRRVARIVAPVFRARDAGQVRATYRPACEMPGRCRPKAAKILGEAEPDALAYLDFPQSRREGPRASDAREGTDGETKRRSRVVQVPPSVGSLTRLVGAVMCERDEGWPESRHLSERRVSEPCGDRPRHTPPTRGRQEELRLIAKQAIEASLELADRMEVA